MDVIKNRISTGDIEGALEVALVNLKNTYKYNSCVVISNRYNHLKRQFIDGSISNESYRIELASISRSLLELIDAKHFYLEKSKRPIYYTLLFFFIFLIFVFVLKFNFFQNKPMDYYEYSEKASGYEHVVQNVEINYFRLFGSYQVPFFVSGYLEGNKKQKDTSIFLNIGPLNSEEVLAAWKIWPHKDAKIVKNSVWDQITQEKFHANVFLYAMKPDKVFNKIHRCMWDEDEVLVTKYDKKICEDIDVFVYDSLHSMQPEPWSYMEAYIQYVDPLPGSDEGLKKYAYCENKFDSLASSIGFLGLILKNDSNKKMKNVKFKFKEFRNNNAIYKIFESQKIDNYLGKTESDYKIMPALNPGEKLLIMLSVYKKNDKDYPDMYLTSVVEPLSIEYRLDGSNDLYRELIRKPLKDKALKIAIPFGWHWQ